MAFHFLSPTEIQQDAELLLQSTEPSVRFKTLVNVLHKDPQSKEVLALQQEIKNSPRVRLLLSERGADGEIPLGAYSKWQGAHWVLSLLADLGYPPGDASLIPMREQVLSWLLSDEHLKMVMKLTINGRVRRCASQEGNALYAMLTLGIADERAAELARRLVAWQWADGGWNCDRNPDAIHSSYMETIIPTRALALYARISGDEQARAAAERATEVFLKRRLYQRQTDGTVINPNFIKLHYPVYWHYDILFALKVLAEGGFIHDERCSDALELLRSKRLPAGGFPAEGRYYQVNPNARTSRSLVDWGKVNHKKMNEFVSADALFVLSTVAI